MIRVKDIMKTQLEVVSPDDSLNEVIKRMLVKNIHHLLVSEADQLVGLLSVRDLDVIGNEKDREGLLVRAAMITNISVTTPDTPIQEAAQRMLEHTFGCLPVVENDKLVGIITTRDMLALLATATG